jgi:hypothetical protein
MKTLVEPERGGGGARPTLVIVLVVVLVVIAIVVAVWLVARPPAEAPKGPPVAPRARTSSSPRVTPLPSETRATPRPRPEPRPRREPRPEVAAPALRVDADVPGANVYLDRKFLGTTPVETRDFSPGPHRLNVTTEGYDMYGETIELAAEPRDVLVRFKEVRLDERVDVVHKHGIGSCHGRLFATTAGLRYEADKPGHSFEAAFASLEPLQVDYLSRNLRVKVKGGRTWNFTSVSADALLAFQKAVEKARARM